MSQPSAHILVVEDESSIREGLCDVLAFHGYTPEGVARGDTTSCSRASTDSRSVASCARSGRTFRS
jgi:DNA-binding response OmpR family regulator